MEKVRLEAFSDGVIAIIITIMVLELKVPHSADLAALKDLLPTFLSYVLSFVYVGIYWNNHHHMFHVVRHINGRIMWANTHLLFWLSLVPFTTNWMDETGLAPLPTAVYGISLLMAAIAYMILQRNIINSPGASPNLAKALGTDLKGKISPLLYISGIFLAYINNWLSVLMYVLVALLWLVPDKRIEKIMHEQA